jgi:hemolysin activation/secretion protein
MARRCNGKRFGVCRGGLAVVQLWSVLFVVLASLPLAAQTVGDLLKGVDQNAIMRQYAPPLARPKSLGATVTLPVAGIAPDKLGDTRFRLASIEIEGTQSLSPSQLTPLWQALIGREITLLDIKKVVDAIEETYKKNDLRAGVVVPPQDFAAGHVRINVYEYYIKELIIKGNATDRLRGRLDPFFDRITEMRPLRASQLYRNLLLAEDRAGLSMYGEFIRIEDEPGAIRMEITLTFKPGNLTLGLDNFGVKDIAPVQGQAAAHINDMFGLFEATDFLVVTNPAAPDQFAFVNWAQLVPLGATPFAFNYFVGQSWVAPGGLQRQLQLRSRVLNAGVGLNYALLRSRERNLFLNAGVNLSNLSVDVLQEPVSRDRTRWLTFGARYDDELFGVRFILNPAYVKGVDAFDQNLVNYDFSALTLNGVLSTSFTDTLTAKVTFSAQYGFTALPSPLVAAFGGLAFGRAFDPGSIAGNSAITVAGEIGHTIATGVKWLSDLTLFAYGDYGAVWNPPGITYPFASLASAGFGLRVGITERLIATALVAQPLWYDPELAALGVDQLTRYRFTVALRF